MIRLIKVRHVLWLFSRPLLTRLDPTEAAEELKRNREQFIYNVKTSMRGGSIKGVQYHKVTP